MAAEIASLKAHYVSWSFVHQKIIYSQGDILEFRRKIHHIGGYPGQAMLRLLSRIHSVAAPLRIAPEFSAEKVLSM